MSKPLRLIFLPALVAAVACTAANGNPGTDGGSANEDRADAGLLHEYGPDAGPAPHVIAPERLEWPQAGGEPGRSTWNLSAAHSSYATIWEVETRADRSSGTREPEAMEHSPLVHGDAVIAEGYTVVIAYDLATGAERWRVGRETVRGDGVLANDTAVLALTGVTAVSLATGAEKWRRADLAASGSLLWDGDSVIVPLADAAGGRLVALDPATGETRRTGTLDSSVTSFAACGGRLVAATGDGRVVAWAPDLSAIAWQRSIVAGAPRWSGGVRCASGRVAVLELQSDRLVVLDDQTGDLAWETPALSQTRFAIGGDLLAIGRDATDAFMRVLDLSSGTERWRTSEAAWPVAIFDGAVLTDIGVGRVARTELLDAGSGQPRVAVYGNLAYATAVSCGMLIGGGRGATVAGPTFRLLGDAARVGQCAPSNVY